MQQVKKFNYIWVVFASYDRTSLTRIGKGNAVLRCGSFSFLQRPYAQRSVSKSVFVPILTYGSAGATISRTVRMPRALGRNGRQKNNKYHCVIQKVTNVHQVKVNKHDESEGNTRSRSLWKDKCVTIILLCCIMVNNFLSVSISYIQY